MKKLAIVLLLLFAVASFAQAAELRDIEDSWAKGAIEELVADDVISGYPDGTFKPEKQVSRAEFAKILSLALDWKQEGEANYSDLNSHWAKNYIATAGAHEVITGYPDGTFKPDRSISRAEILTMITRAVKLAEKAEATDIWLPSFIDVNSKHWAFKNVEAANQLGILPSYIGTELKPGEFVTRAETAYLVNSLRKLQIMEGVVAAVDTQDSTINFRPNSGETRLLYVSTQTVIIRNQVSAAIGDLQEGDKLYVAANSIGDPLIIKAFGKVTQADVASRISDATSGLLTKQDISNAMKGNWSAISNNMRGEVYNRLVDSGMTATEAESLVSQDWGGLKGAAQERLAQALADYLNVTPQMVTALFQRDWKELESYAQTELTEQLLSRLVQ
jgi:hypothetical protein